MVRASAQIPDLLGVVRVSPFTEKGHPTGVYSRWIAPFLRANLSRLESSLGVTLERTRNGNLRAALGSGKFGAVFATTDGRVVKITADDAEPIVGTVIQGMQQSSDPAVRGPATRSVVRIDRIVRFPGLVRHDKRDVPVFAILREAVRPARSGDVSHDIVDALDEHHHSWETWWDLWKMTRPTAKRRNQVVQNVWDGWAVLESTDGLENFAEVQRALWNLGIPHMDTHFGNFGFRDATSDLVLFDLGGSIALTAKDLIDPIDADEFTSYFPWKQTLARVEHA